MVNYIIILRLTVRFHIITNIRAKLLMNTYSHIRNSYLSWETKWCHFILENLNISFKKIVSSILKIWDTIQVPLLVSREP